MKRGFTGFADSEVGDSLVEMILITMILAIGCVIVMVVLVGAVNKQAGAANQHSSCITNVSDGSCVK